MTEPLVVHGGTKRGYKLEGSRLVPRGYKLDPTINPAKNPWTSKTLILALISAIAAFFPTVQEFIAAHPELVAQVLAGIFFVLRLVTKGGITLSD